MKEQAEILFAGEPGAGRSLVLDAPISFWGGVNPDTGLIADVRHPQHGVSIAGTVLFVPGLIGSSSASSVQLELVRARRAPSALVLHEADAILLLGLIVARELGWTPPMAVRLGRERFEPFRGAQARVDPDGTVRRVG